jgi:hypothetical protein
MFNIQHDGSLSIGNFVLSNTQIKKFSFEVKNFCTPNIIPFPWLEDTIALKLAKGVNTYFIIFHFFLTFFIHSFIPFPWQLISNQKMYSLFPWYAFISYSLRLILSFLSICKCKSVHNKFFSNKLPVVADKFQFYFQKKIKLCMHIQMLRRKIWKFWIFLRFFEQFKKKNWGCLISGSVALFHRILG